MYEPVKIGLGEYLLGFYGTLNPSTKPLKEFIGRGFGKSVAWAASRMVDEAEAMLSSWQRNDTDSAPTQPFKLPVIMVAIAKDYTPTGREYTRQLSENVKVILPGDPKERCFGVRTIAGDIRAQIAIFASDEPTAKSIAAQLCLYLDAFPNRRFSAKYNYAGVSGLAFPVQIETAETPATSVNSGSKNMTILAVDLTLRTSIPLFNAPLEGQPNDGKGIPGTDDPAGYPLVVDVIKWNYLL